MKSILEESQSKEIKRLVTPACQDTLPYKSYRTCKGELWNYVHSYRNTWIAATAEGTSESVLESVLPHKARIWWLKTLLLLCTSDRRYTLRQCCSVMAGAQCALPCLYPECHVQRKVYIQEIFVYESSFSPKRRGCGLHREALPWHSGLCLVMRDAKFGQWSYLFAYVKSSDCAQCFWRDEGSGMDVHVLRMCPRRVKVALSPWEEGETQFLP